MNRTMPHFYMQMHAIKNIQFSRLVKAAGRLREFNFTKYRGEDGQPMFSIDVVDQYGNRIIFHMQRDAESWKIVDENIPSWISSNEQSFHDLIEEELRQAS